MSLLFFFSQPHLAFSYSQEDHKPTARDLALQAQEDVLCWSTVEFKRALNFMRQNKFIVMNEVGSRQLAERVARGCNGASERFEKMLAMLKTIGLSDKKALEIALEFSGYDTEVQTNFLEIFNKAFLSEFFDYDYTSAARLAYELSKEFKGDPVQVREDFIELVRFCKDGKKLDLPLNFCAEFAVKVAKLSQYYEEGVRQPFYSFYTALRERKDLSLDMKTALDISYNVLKAGPRAVKNFMEAFEFGLSDKGLMMTKDEALSFALRMARRSHVGDAPPVIPSKKVRPEAARAAAL